MYNSLMAIAITGTLTSLVASTPVGSQLPVVDLGYTRQRASDFNSTGGYYTFSNIAYAQPPIGPLRFAAPQPPRANSSIQDPRLVAIKCPQGTPLWLSGGFPVPPDSSEQEDCLYLDVFAPKKTLEKARKGCVDAPVLVWIHGGGSVLGSKAGLGTPSGMLAQKKAREQGMIFVAINYRLGSFGFLNGPEFNKEGGFANAGLLDQRMALNWIQDNIHRFGGKKERITLMGESGGAQYIVNHLSANQQKYGKLSVQQAIFQSTAGIPPIPDIAQDDIFSRYKKALNVTTLTQARSLDTATLQTANREFVRNVAFGLFPFQVETKKGGYVDKSTPQSIQTSAPLYRTKVMVGTNLNEGIILVDPNDLANPFRDFIQQRLPGYTSSELSYIEDTLYPASAFSNEFTRRAAFGGDLFFDCNGYAIEKAFNSSGFRYRFSIPPAVHTSDLAYTWYQGTETQEMLGDGFNATVARSMQEYFTNFAVTRDANSGDLPNMPIYGKDGKVLDLTSQGFNVINDPLKNQRCEYWIKK